MLSSNELMACSDQLVNQEYDHFEVARRSKKVDVKGTEYLIDQIVSTFRNFEGETSLDIRPNSLEEVSQNSHWFERHLNRDVEYNSTTLGLRPGTIRRGGSSCSGSIVLPQRFKESGYGNGGLIDPVIGKEVPFESSIYDARWMQISKWMLDELRNPNQLFYSLGWSSFISSGDGKEQEVQLIEAADTHVFISADETEDPVGVSRSFLFYEKSDGGGQSYSVYLRLDNKPTVIRNNAFLKDEGERYPTLDQDGDSKDGEKARALLTGLPYLVEIHTL